MDYRKRDLDFHCHISMCDHFSMHVIWLCIIKLLFMALDMFLIYGLYYNSIIQFLIYLIHVNLCKSFIDFMHDNPFLCNALWDVVVLYKSILLLFLKNILHVHAYFLTA